MDQGLHGNRIKQILVLLNQGSRQGESMRAEIEKVLGECGITAIKIESPSVNNYKAVIESYASQIDAVGVAGGDGSINLALPGILATGKPLLVIPCGTANNLARNLNIPTRVEDACRLAASTNFIEVDVATVNGIPFLNVVGLGLSTQVNRMSNPKLKKWFGIFAYVFYAFKVARRMNPFSVFVDDGHGEVKFKALQVSVCNGKFYGSGLIIADDASIFDGKLDLVATQVKKWWSGLKLIPALLRGRHQTKREIYFLRSEFFRLRTRKPMSVDVDGDIRTATPLEFKMSSQKLKVFVP